MKFTFNHHNINVFDLERSLVFYKDNLGLTEVRRKNAEDGSFTLVYLGDGITRACGKLRHTGPRKDQERA